MRWWREVRDWILGALFLLAVLGLAAMCSVVDSTYGTHP